MAGLVGIAIFALFVMAGVGLLLSGIASIRQARLAKKMFNLRYRNERHERDGDSEAN